MILGFYYSILEDCIIKTDIIRYYIVSNIEALSVKVWILSSPNIRIPLEKFFIVSWY